MLLFLCVSFLGLAQAGLFEKEQEDPLIHLTNANFDLHF